MYIVKDGQGDIFKETTDIETALDYYEYCAVLRGKSEVWIDDYKVLSMEYWNTK